MAIKVLLLGDGRHDRGDLVGKAGAAMNRSKWGALQFLVERALLNAGVHPVEFTLPLHPSVANRDGHTKKPLPPQEVYKQQIRFFMKEALQSNPQMGLVVVIQDQDCDPDRLQRLQKHLSGASAGLGGPPCIPAVAIECTENWLLCQTWPPTKHHPACVGLEHPKDLGCKHDKNQAKPVFNELHGVGLEPRRRAAQAIAAGPAWQLLCQAEDFCALHDDLVAFAQSLAR